MSTLEQDLDGAFERLGGCCSTSRRMVLAQLAARALSVHAKVHHGSSNLGRTLPALALVASDAHVPGAVQEAHGQAMVLVTAASDDDPALLPLLAAQEQTRVVEDALWGIITMVLTELELTGAPPSRDLLAALVLELESSPGGAGPVEQC